MEQRIIKFRAFNEQMNRMDYFGLGDTVPYYYKDENSPAISYEIMQFTGLTDKNGKEIYEGDIIKDIYGKIWEITIRDLEDGIVLYNRKTDGCSCEHASNEFSLTECEVIGNIYENPELLTK